jgi:circadian clock protein KaiB
MPPIELTLYVAGRTPRSQRAIANLRRLVDEELASGCEVHIVDVTEDPEAAETHRILTTPTLLKLAPAPQRRITGDLSDAAKVLLGLALDTFAPPQEDRP